MQDPLLKKIEKFEYLEFDKINKPDFTYYFPSNNPLILGDGAEIALKHYTYWNEIPNICPKYNNDKIRIKYNNKYHDISIPAGMYEVKHLSTYLNRVLVLNKDVLDVNEPEPPQVLELAVDTSTFHCLVKLSDGVEIDFSEGELYKLLGLEPRVYKTSERGKNFINITRGLDKIYIMCNLVERKFQNEFKNVLYSIINLGLPGESVSSEVETLEYYPCNSRFIREINIKLTDQNGTPLHLNESYNIKLIFKHNVTVK